MDLTYHDLAELTKLSEQYQVLEPFMKKYKKLSYIHGQPGRQSVVQEAKTRQGDPVSTNKHRDSGQTPVFP